MVEQHFKGLQKENKIEKETNERGGKIIFFSDWQEAKEEKG